MKSRFINSKWCILVIIFGLVILIPVAALLILYPYSHKFDGRGAEDGFSTSIDTRYMSEVIGIDTPEEMQQQYKRHPEAYKFALEDDFVVMFAYPDSDIRWVGMVFIHHFPSLSEVVLDYDGNVIYEQITSPEIQMRVDRLLNDEAFVVQLQNQMGEVWGLVDPGQGILDLVESLQLSGIDVEFQGGRPQTLFEAAMFQIRINGQDINVYEFADETARAAVSDHISPSGSEFTQQQGEKSVVLHIEYQDQSNFWVQDHLLVQYIGHEDRIIESVSAVLGSPITNHDMAEIDILPSDEGLSAYLELPEHLEVGQAVNLKFTLTNYADNPLYILKWYTPLEGIAGEIFRITRHGQTMPYEGILASRAVPTPDEYALLGPGESLSAVVDLATSFDFSEPGTYQIEFISPRISHIAYTEDEMAGSYDDLGPVQIPSNKVLLDVGDN